MLEQRVPKRPNSSRDFRNTENGSWPFVESYYKLPLKLSLPAKPEESLVWAPQGEIYEKRDSFIFRFELPDLKPEDADISVSEDTLTIKGKHKPPEDLIVEEDSCTEYCYGTFYFSMTMPVPVDSEKVGANFENGMLVIYLPKTGGSIPKRIKVKAK